MKAVLPARLFSSFCIPPVLRIFIAFSKLLRGGWLVGLVSAHFNGRFWDHIFGKGLRIAEPVYIWNEKALRLGLRIVTTSTAKTEILQEQRKNASAKKLQLDAPAYDLLNPYWSIGKTSAHLTGKIPPRNTKACRNEGFGAQHFTRNRDLALCLMRLGDEGITLN
ncbi:hypothetical protein TWF132_000682 [Orbilia oligospora]|nr:hypothetical protein TWF128_011988 [Orbilia oligospora]KAF3279323.1 hypothetical protein TWF132_000682 [Orbilia oligospora]